MKRLVVLISGDGDNLQPLIDNVADGVLEVEIAAVVSDSGDAQGLFRARKAGIATQVIDRDDVLADGGSDEGFAVELAGLVAAYQPDLVVLAGWTHTLDEGFLDHFPDRVIKLHPAMPGAFPGARAVERAHDAFQRGEIKRTGVMVHRVVANDDAGPVVTMEPVPIFPGEPLEDLEERVRLVEHNLIVAAVDLLLGDYEG